AVRAHGGRALAFGHGHASRALAARWLGQPVAEGRLFRLDTACRDGTTLGAVSLAASCPKCTSPVTDADDALTCRKHGLISQLWRPAEADSPPFAELAERLGDQPAVLPSPLSPGWTTDDFGCVASAGRALARVTTTVGTSDLDGPV